MGNKVGKVQLKSKDVSKLSSQTGFEAEEIKALYAQFLVLKSSEGADETATMNFTEFQAALGYRNAPTSLFIERIFRIFDENGDGSITFEEFVGGLSLLTPTAIPEKKLRFTFQIYDVSRKGAISQSDLRDMLLGVLKENDVPMSDDQVNRLVLDTFAQHDLNKDGYIDFEEYRQMCIKSPSILKPLTLNVTELIAQARSDAEASERK